MIKINLFGKNLSVINNKFEYKKSYNFKFEYKKSYNFKYEYFHIFLHLFLKKMNGCMGIRDGDRFYKWYVNWQNV